MLHSSLTILYDGWSLVREPNGSAALHLLAILACLPPEIEPVVALPQTPPAWLGGARCAVRDTPDTLSGRLSWEQFRLPGLARQTQAQLIHSTEASAPLFGARIGVASPGLVEGSRYEGERSLAWRLLVSARRGGLARAQAVFWPEGLPAPDLMAHLVRLPQLVHPDFRPTRQDAQRGSNGASAGEQALLSIDLPETFVLYHGPGDRQQLDRLLKAWSWAAGAIGEYYPLLALGLDAAAAQELGWLAAKYEVGDSVRALPEISPYLVPAIYRGCSALFHPAPARAWGGAVQHAMASGKPIAGSEGELMEALVGPAAYLAPVGEARATGAALLTVIVEEEVTERLSAAATLQAASWDCNRFGGELAGAYRRLLQAA
jgi:hypothetical protein